MSMRLNLLSLSVAVLTVGCASGPPFIDQAQPEAMAIAQRRAAFEFNCPAATTQLLSRETLQPVSFRFGIERAEYTVGVSGCGKRATYVVICPDQPGSTCFAAAGRDGIQ
ncbi:MAG TPA: hypothetical protein VET87_00235 [Rubrivivax sp.]|jgi:hypothetical protein|nr:hypothetical protein [Rubrivivax sp.]